MYSTSETLLITCVTDDFDDAACVKLRLSQEMGLPDAALAFLISSVETLTVVAVVAMVGVVGVVSVAAVVAVAAATVVVASSVSLRVAAVVAATMSSVVEAFRPLLLLLSPLLVGDVSAASFIFCVHSLEFQ